MSRSISGKVKAFVFDRDKGKCVYCGSTENLEFDHIIPASKGGSNSENNIQVVCMKCNSVKFNYIDDDNILEKRNKPKRRKFFEEIIISKKILNKLKWKNKDIISILYEPYNDDFAISIIKNRSKGYLSKFHLHHNGLGIIKVPRMVLLIWLDNPKTNSYKDEIEIKVKTIDNQQGLFLWKRENESDEKKKA